MAAKVFFEDTEDMENALMKRLIIDGKKSVWAESDARTCHECGSVGHFVKDCSARAKRRERRVYREFNSLPKRVQTAQIKAGFSFAAALKGNNPSPTVAPTQFVHQQADFPALQSGPTTKTKGKGVVRNGESSVQPIHVKTPTAENIREMVQQEVAGVLENIMRGFMENVERILQPIRMDIERIQKQVQHNTVEALPHEDQTRKDIQN
ncbi:hypothetical protein BGW42_008558, partial [Actinomortierella wolfii]